MRISLIALTSLLIFVSDVFAEFSAPCPFQNLPTAYQPAERKVKLTILGARVLGSADTDIWPFVDRADVYGSVTIGDQTFSLPEIAGSDSPNWISGNVFVKQVPNGESAISVTISLIDRDGDASGDDDVLDINADPTKQAMTFTLDTCSLRISVAGSSTDFPSQGLLTFRGNNFPDSSYAEVDVRVEFADGRPATSDDVALTELQPVQVIHNATGLVSGKPFVVMGRFANNFNNAIDTDVEISISGAGISRTDRFAVNLQPGQVKRMYFYSDSPLIPNVTGPDYLSMTARIDPDGKFTGSLSGDDCRRRNDFIGLEPADGLRYATFRTPNQYVHWVRIQPAIGPMAAADTNRFRDLSLMGSDLAQAMFPVASVGRNIDYDRWTPAVSAAVLDTILGMFNALAIPANAATPFVTLFEMNFRAALGGVRKYVGVLHANYLPSILWGVWEGTPGVSLMTVGSRAVLVSEGWANGEDSFRGGERLSSVALPVHELGHSYGMSVEPSIKDVFGCGVDDPLGLGELWCGIAGGYDEYTHANPDLRKGFPSTGYWVRRGDEHANLTPLSNAEICDTHGVMGSSARADYLEWTNPNRRKWIDRANYEFLFGKFAFSELFGGLSTSATAEEEKKPVDSIVLAGIIDYRDKVAMMPLWRVGTQVPDRDESDVDGVYLARFLGADGKALQQIGIPLDWVRGETGSPGVPITFFTYVLPFPQGTSKIEILNRFNGKTLYTQKVSRSRPEIKFETTQKSMFVKRGTKLKLNWSADDKDLRKISRKSEREKKLFYSVLIRDPNLKEDSTSWKVLEANLRKTSATIDTSKLTLPEYRVKIMVSDGVNVNQTPERRLKIMK